MAYTKPMVTIDLEEYLDLKSRPKSSEKTYTYTEMCNVLNAAVDIIMRGIEINVLPGSVAHILESIERKGLKIVPVPPDTKYAGGYKWISDVSNLITKLDKKQV